MKGPRHRPAQATALFEDSYRRGLCCRHSSRRLDCYVWAGARTAAAWEQRCMHTFLSMAQIPTLMRGSATSSSADMPGTCRAHLAVSCCRQTAMHCRPAAVLQRRPC